MIKKVRNKKKFKVQLIASGTHFSKKFGSTFKEINKSKIKINNKIILKYDSKGPASITSVMAKCLNEATKLFKTMKPDLVIVLGDRYEILAFSLSAYISKIPIAHIHGGEVTRGVLDDAFRHSITKLSHIHFVANREYRKRVIQLGENPKNVYVVGGLGADSITNTKLISKKKLRKSSK